MAMSTAATVTSLDGFHTVPAAQRADKLVRALFDAVNADDPARIDAVVARSFLSYDVRATRSRTGLKRYHSDLRRSFSELRFEVHENVGVLVEGDLVALRTIITGTHTGDYAGVAPTGNPIQTSASHIFRCSRRPACRALAGRRHLPHPGRRWRHPQGGERLPADPRRGRIARRALPGATRNRVRPTWRTTRDTRGVPGRRAPPLRRGDLDRAHRGRRHGCRGLHPELGLDASTAAPPSRAPWRSAAERCPTGAPYRRTWLPRTIGSPREACGMAPSPRAAGQRTLRLSTSSASRTDSLPSTGRRSTGSGPISPSGSSLTTSMMAELERTRLPSVLRSGRVQLVWSRRPRCLPLRPHLRKESE